MEIKNYRNLRDTGNVEIKRERGRVSVSPVHIGLDNSTLLEIAQAPPNNGAAYIGLDIENQVSGASSRITAVNGTQISTLDNILWNNGDIGNVFRVKITHNQKIYDRYTGEITPEVSNLDITQLKDTLPSQRAEIQDELADINAIISDIQALLP